jgi:WD40 repeat protein
MIKLSIQAEGQPAVERVFDGTSVSIGRHESNLIALAMHGVSARHCSIVQIGNTYEVEDLGSMNGTYVNGVRVRGRQAITPADHVVVANFTIRLVADAPVNVSSGVGKGVSGGKTLATQVMSIRPQDLAAMRQAGAQYGAAPAGSPTIARPATISPFGDNSPFVPTGPQEAPAPGGTSGNQSFGPGSYGAPPLDPFANPNITGGPGGYAHAAHGGGASNPAMGAAGSFSARPFDGQTPYGNAGFGAPTGPSGPSGPSGPPPQAHGGAMVQAPGFGLEAGGFHPRQDSLFNERDPAAAAREPVAARLYDLVDPMAQAWEQQGKPTSMLLGGDDLRDAKTWIARGIGSYPRPNLLHQTYVRASLKQATTQKLKFLIWPAAALVVLGGAVVVAKLMLGPDPVAPKPSEEVNTSTKAELTLEERSDAIAALAENELAQHQDLAILLAVEGLSVAQKAGIVGISRSEQVLRKALAQAQGEVHWGHQGAVRTTIFASDSRRWMSGGADGVVRIWGDSASGLAKELAGHSEGITTLALSGDGRWLFSASDDRTIRRWDLNAKDPGASALTLRGHMGRVSNLALSPDGSWLASSGSDPVVRVWNLKQDDPNVGVVELHGHTGAVTALAVLGNGAALASGGVDRQIRVTALKDGRPKGAAIVLDGKNGSVAALAAVNGSKGLVVLGADGAATYYAPGRKAPSLGGAIALTGLRTSGVALVSAKKGEVIATVGDDKKVVLMSLASADPNLGAQTVTHTGQAITSAALSENADALAVGDEGGVIAVWNLEGLRPTGEPILLHGHEGPVRSLAFSPDGLRLSSGGDDRSARIWEFRSLRGGMSSEVGRAHAERVGAVALNREGTRLVSGGADGVLQLWSIDASTRLIPLRRLVGPKGRVSGLALAHNDRWLVAASQDGMLRLWDLENGSDKPLEIRQHSAEIYTLGITPDERWLVSGGQDNEAYIWPFSPEGVGKAQRLAGHQQPVLALGFSDDGKWVASASQDHTVNLWDVSLGLDKAKGKRLRGHESTVWAVSISPDGRFMASAGDDRNIHLRRLEDPSAAPLVLRGHQGSTRALAFSSDSKWLASGSDDKSIRIWDLSSAHPDEGSRVFEGLEGSISGLTFDPKTPRLISATNDGTVRIWDLSTKRDNPAAIILQGHSNTISMLRGDQKGAFVVTASADKTVRLWPTDTKWLSSLACRAAGRSMSQEEWGRHLPFFQYRATCPMVEGG